MEQLTDRQWELHSYLCDHWNDQPAYREMATHFGVGLNAVMGHLKALQKKGYIELPDGKRSRGIKLLIGPNLDGTEIEIAGRTYRLHATEE